MSRVATALVLHTEATVATQERHFLRRTRVSVRESRLTCAGYLFTKRPEEGQYYPTITIIVQLTKTITAAFMANFIRQLPDLAATIVLLQVSFNRRLY